jgi:hypothetical protein
MTTRTTERRQRVKSSTMSRRWGRPYMKRLCVLALGLGVCLGAGFETAFQNHLPCFPRRADQELLSCTKQTRLGEYFHTSSSSTRYAFGQMTIMETTISQHNHRPLIGLIPNLAGNSPILSSAVIRDSRQDRSAIMLCFRLRPSVFCQDVPVLRRILVRLNLFKPSNTTPRHALHSDKLRKVMPQPGDATRTYIKPPKPSLQIILFGRVTNASKKRAQHVSPHSVT